MLPPLAAGCPLRLALLPSLRWGPGQARVRVGPGLITIYRVYLVRRGGLFNWQQLLFYDRHDRRVLGWTVGLDCGCRWRCSTSCSVPGLARIRSSTRSRRYRVLPAEERRSPQPPTRVLYAGTLPQVLPGGGVPDEVLDLAVGLVWSHVAPL